VPFRALEDAFMLHKMGVTIETLALGYRTKPSVIEAIIKFQKRRALRNKYGALIKGPA
jgi:3-polyprenyl-4-hydroxybenzoate decarboxylase